MSLEPGGRADKYGNEYENRFLARLLLRVVNQELTSVIVEPLGENSDSVEFIAELPDGPRGYYQCKSSNGIQQSWTISSLSKLQIPQRAREILVKDQNACYYFISPLPYGELDEICKRARTNTSSEHFLTYQVADSCHKTVFDLFCRCLGLDPDMPADVREAITLLARSHYELYPFNDTTVQDLEERIGLTFTGDSSAVRVLLEQYANAHGRYGTKIIAHEVVGYLSEKGYYLRGDLNSKRALTRIQELNISYWPQFSGINGKLMHRTSTDHIMAAIASCQAVVICGNAGCGKSGCVQEVINNLKDQGILYLAIKLDRFVPATSADRYGEDLGLEQSPVFVLAKLAAGKKCVLILDQLDALHWTDRRSNTALEVCKEMIRQASVVNHIQNGAISILFASRQFDLEHDHGLRMLFEPNDHSTKRITVKEFSESEVRTVIGEAYDTLPAKLKSMLLTPSSLYVWTQLSMEKRNHQIMSVYALMTAWWQNILDVCECNGIQNAKECKDKIVKYMDCNHTHSLYATLFCEENRAIQMFRSLGMLRSGTNRIEFIHQSFLDFFVSSSDLGRVLCGEDVTALLPPLNAQYPNVRYRLLILLQALIDCSEASFIKQAKLILESDLVHYYIKCCVFDIIVQLASPTKQVLFLLDDYYERPVWKGYIDRVVFEGHPAFLKHYAKSTVDWMEPHNLNLLRSITAVDPNFVVSVLRPHAMKNHDDDKRIYYTLPYDLDDDSEESFQFRIDLLRNRPELLCEFPFIIDYAIDRSSPHAIDILEVIIHKWPNIRIPSSHMATEASFPEYAETHYQEIAERLLPAIIEVTREYLPKWGNISLHSDYDDWIESSYSDTSYRSIVKLTKYAMASMAKNDAAAFCAILQSLTYPLSGIGHEIIMYGMQALSVEYSDCVITWLLADFLSRVFVFSDHREDYLKDSKVILQRYSPHCSEKTFEHLEQVILDWQDDRDQRIYSYRMRLEHNRQEDRVPDYHPNWGYFQKEMLPCLCSVRISKKSSELLAVLNRNNWIYTPFYRFYIISEDAKFVVSPVEGYTELLSDQAWLNIISTSDERMRGWKNRGENKTYYFESTHYSFASSLGTQAKREPMRFAALSLQFPQDCYRGYVRNVLYAMAGSTETLSDECIQLYSEVLLYHRNDDDACICSAIVGVIESHPETCWPGDVLSLLSDFAINHPDPALGEYTVTNSEDPEHHSAQSLLTNSINCVRGRALHTISLLMKNRPVLTERFAKIIKQACCDPHESVRYAAMSCAMAYYFSDKDTAFELIQGLIQKDLRFFYSSGIWQIISDTYSEHKVWYCSAIYSAVQSDVDDLSVYAAGLLCAVAMMFKDSEMMQYLMTHSFSDKQRDSICKQAVHLFSNDEFHEASEAILRNLVESGTSGLNCINQLFYHNCISIHRDGDFLRFLMKSSIGPGLLHAFLRFLKESDGDLQMYSDVLYDIGENMLAHPEKQKGFLDLDEYLRCILRLFDRAENSPSIRSTCLSTWDNMFMSNITGYKPIASYLDDVDNM